MSSPSAQRRKADPLKEINSEISSCRKELTRARREVEKLEGKLESLLTKQLDLVGRMKDGL